MVHQQEFHHALNWWTMSRKSHKIYRRRVYIYIYIYLAQETEQQSGLGRKAVINTGLTSDWEWLRLNSLCRWRDTSFCFWRHEVLFANNLTPETLYKITHTDGTTQRIHHNLMFYLTLVAPFNDRQSLKIWAGPRLTCNQPAPAISITHSSNA